MHFPVPDPSYADSVAARASLRLAARISFGFVVLLWLVHFLNWAFDVDPWPFGVQPRELAGLPGIVLAPLVHSNFAHLAANSLPVLVLGTAMLYLYPGSALRALPAIYLGPGIVVWGFGRASVHLGASGLIYGLAAYIFVAGLLRRDRRAIGASLVVAFMYGSLLLGFLPLPPEISWETHLSAAVIGVAAALWLRRYDVVPRKRYAWESAGEHQAHEDEARAEPGGVSDDGPHGVEGDLERESRRPPAPAP